MRHPLRFVRLLVLAPVALGLPVPAAATRADGNILVLHRGARPIMVFAPDGTFVRA